MSETAPKVLDARGNPLSVGSRVNDRVRFRGHPEHRATVTAIKWNYGWEVWLRGPDDPRAAEDFEAFVQPDKEPNTYRCPDLELIDPNTNKEESRAHE